MEMELVFYTKILSKCNCPSSNYNNEVEKLDQGIELLPEDLVLRKIWIRDLDNIDNSPHPKNCIRLLAINKYLSKNDLLLRIIVSRIRKRKLRIKEFLRKEQIELNKMDSVDEDFEF